MNDKLLNRRNNRFPVGNLFVHKLLVTQANPAVVVAMNMLSILFRETPTDIRFRLWEGSEIRIGRRETAPVLHFSSPSSFASMLLFRNPLQLAESYFNGGLNISGNIYNSLKIRHHLSKISLTLNDKITLFFASLYLLIFKRSVSTNTVRAWRQPPRLFLDFISGKQLNKAAIAFHYDISNEFYRLWLDEQMIYSCAYYRDVHESLEQAQQNKLQHICRKLRLKPGDTLLDIGCGWGALACFAAENYGVIIHGITLSQRQFEFATNQICEKDLGGRVTVELKDYRDLHGEYVYDKIVSVGMFEHVGLKNLQNYFEIVNRQLKPGGVFLNHGITMDRSGWKKSVGTKFINTYVFPDGQLDTVSNVQRRMEDNKFEINDVECLRMHYAITLKEWGRRLQSQHKEALRYVDESIYRVWKLYMAGCAQQFEEGNIGVYQILASKRATNYYSLPLIRDDLYR